ncbi:MAG: leucine-rich repeat domain-containing protein [Muribaculaceae bacterium]|nr:leucine-rich repeat domain-containing protein [Muribaculaceae bacterium]
MKQRLYASALAALATLSSWAYVRQEIYVIDQEKALGGIQYYSPDGKDDSETTVIKVPETFTYTGVNYTIIAISGSFSKYKNLQKIYIPKTLEYVGYSRNINPKAFQHWDEFLPYIAEIEIDPENEHYTVENNIVLSKDKTITFGTPYKNSPQHLEIPDGVEYIYSSAFHNLPITSVKLPQSLIGVGLSAFRNTKLKEVNLPQNIKYIGNAAFTSPEREGTFEYRVEVKNIPPTLIFDDLRWGTNTYNVCYDEEIYINPGYIATSRIYANPDAFPNLKSVRKDGLHGNTMAAELVDYAQKYHEKGLSIPAIYANDSVIAACKHEIKRAEASGKPFSTIPEMISTGPVKPLIPGTEPEKISKIEDAVITIDKTNYWLSVYPEYYFYGILNQNHLQSGTINSETLKLVESQEYPGQYYLRNSNNDIYMGRISPWTPDLYNLMDCRLIAFHDTDPALFTITDNGDGSYSITDSEGYPLCPGYESYNILRGKSDFDRYNSNIALSTELRDVMAQAKILCETEGLLPYLVNSPEQLHSEHSEPTEGSFANLFDDNVYTYWHSIWSSSLNVPRHNLDMIFADGQTARNIIVDYKQRLSKVTKLDNARFHWSTDGGETFSNDYIEFTGANGLNDDGGELKLELDVDANALRLSGVGKNAVYWAISELRVRDANAKPIIEYSEEGRLELEKALAEVDVYPATGNFAESIAKLRALMESIKNGTYGGIETTMTESTEQAVEWYNLQGRRITHPTPGQIYIRRSANHTTTKIKL